MMGAQFRSIRKKLGITKNQFAIELGYRGNDRNNCMLIKRYEQGRKQIPLTVASLAWLIEFVFDQSGKLPDWPEWEGYDLELVPRQVEASVVSPAEGK
jgi:transcriptional regulator with XRE-family HTH domain